MPEAAASAFEPKRQQTISEQTTRQTARGEITRVVTGGRSVFTASTARLGERLPRALDQIAKAQALVDAEPGRATELAALVQEYKTSLDPRERTDGREVLRILKDPLFALVQQQVYKELYDESGVTDTGTK